VAGIRLLPAEVAERIAAGEVIDRPAAAVKELIENAVDAGATEIRIDVRGGGLRLIRVADNGGGIPADEVELAFRRHATSKLHELADLERVESYGFRGEALPSLAAVADVDVLTAVENSQGVACSFRAGRLLERVAAARSRGTTITVRDLFTHMPARLKFMRGARGEATEIGAVVRRFTLARPELKLTLVLEGHIAFRADGGDLTDALVAVHGAGAEHAFLPVGPAEAAGVHMHGVVAGRTLTRSNRSQVAVFVNGRYVRPRGLLTAVEEGYHRLLPRGRHAVAALFLDVPPADLDVNIHPAKLDVRLRHEATVARALTEAVQRAYGRYAEGFSPRVDLALSGRQGRLAGMPRRLAEERPGWSWERSGGAELPPGGALPAMRLVGQLHESLLVAETEEGFYLIDQHRAHERVIYERLLEGLDASQTLLEPALVQLPREEARRLAERLAALKALGFDCEEFGPDRFVLRSAPTAGDLAALTGALPELLREAAADGQEWEQRLLASLACRSAVRKGRLLAQPEAHDLVHRLRETESPAVCPHGSPLLVFVPQPLLVRQFGWS
jgi:DNA mismatch repair protein MutL